MTQIAHSLDAVIAAVQAILDGRPVPTIALETDDTGARLTALEADIVALRLGQSEPPPAAVAAIDPRVPELEKSFAMLGQRLEQVANQQPTAAVAGPAPVAIEWRQHANMQTDKHNDVVRRINQLEAEMTALAMITDAAFKG